MKVKICGIKSENELAIALNAGADAVGFITDVPVETPRKISIELAASLISKVPVFVTSVMVIMPKNADHALEMTGKAKPSAVQVHNDLDIAELVKIRESGIKLIKTLKVSQDSDPEALVKQVNELKGIADAVLLDTAVGGKTGGTGVTHNWDVSAMVVRRSSLPVILAGGLIPGNVREAVETVCPYAVDTASGVENGGIKDEKKVREFIRNAKTYGI
ncbi:MAG: phosphoribosylanthranilate isomerase [Candidatus Methanoperedens sp.]|jgi:phosphoribosylanthranilate isomerase|nr:phosphoribosylanthranilate isomerase [Candidatus Methanoperedens sp.]PKL54382.1 MAG: N-(5'-phosphoribosyl)anthranilate isomerase [Candidatus Methanoperedenaceae archaeon HGW-Methanoperedenaceae-1]